MGYMVPLCLIAIFISTAFLAPRSTFYAVLFVLQVCFYLAALVSSALEKEGLNVRYLSLPQYFVITNLPSLIAFVKFHSGERYARWEPSRE